MVGMYIIIPIVTFIIGGLLAWLGMRFLLKSKYDSVLQEAEKEAEVIKKNKMLEVKEKFLHLKADLEKQVSQRNAKIQSVETKLKQRELTMNQRQEELQRRNNEVEAVKENLSSQLELVEKKKQDLDKLHQKEVEHLEAISGLSAEEAKERLIESLKDEAKTQAASYINEIVEEAKMTANKEAKKIVIQSIQRVATETAIENSITVFHIESDEIKGRIIGREGRNIRTFEQVSGVNLVIDDTPETVVLSSFDPVRRETARVALENLIADGRIHPARIEEMYHKAADLVQQRVREAGEQAAFDTGIHDLHPEIVKTLGALRYRTSFGQNVLQHSLEVSDLCGVMASELGLDVVTAKRAGLLHDLGKAIDHDVEGPHAVIGAELARRYGEKPVIVHAIEAHHADVDPNTVLDVLVQAADAVSASRPGARRESAENYIKRLEKLEEIANSHDGVERTYAMQAGREVHVMVQPDKISDAQSTVLAHDIAHQIEEEMEYPGQVRVVVIRESRAVDIAK